MTGGPMPRRHRSPAISSREAGRFRVDEEAARTVAACYLGGGDRARDPLVRSAYRALEAQTDVLLDRVLRRWRHGPLQLVSTSVCTPYADDGELALAVLTTRTLEVPTVDPDRRHPLIGCEPCGPYDRLRALHDLVGHVLPRFGFDRDGEFAAWRTQDRHYRGLARWALATELHAQHCVLWTTGHLAEPKAVLIDPVVLSRSHHGARDTSRSAAPRPARGSSPTITEESS